MNLKILANKCFQRLTRAR